MRHAGIRVTVLLILLFLLPLSRSAFSLTNCRTTADCAGFAGEDTDPCTPSYCVNIGTRAADPQWVCQNGASICSPGRPVDHPVDSCTTTVPAGEPFAKQCCALGYDVPLHPQLLAVFKCCVENLSVGRPHDAPCCPTQTECAPSTTDCPETPPVVIENNAPQREQMTPPTAPKVAVAPGTCEVACVSNCLSEGKKVVGGANVGWQVTYAPPAAVMGATSVSLIQTGGKQVRMEEGTTEGEGSDVTAPKAMSTKTIADASSPPPPFTVYTPPPSLMFGKFEQPFTVEVQMLDLAGNPVWTGTCGGEPHVNAGGGGCSLIR